MGSLIQRIKNKINSSWALKSLLIGLCCGVVDTTIGTSLVYFLDVPTRIAAMSALTVGTTLNFLAQRYFAFKEKDAKVAGPAMRWIIMTLCQTFLHGQIVVMMRDWWGVPYVPAKLTADLLVFTGLQLLLVRYVVFPKKKDAAATSLSSEPTPSPAAEPAPR